MTGQAPSRIEADNAPGAAPEGLGELQEPVVALEARSGELRSSRPSVSRCIGAPRCLPAMSSRTTQGTSRVAPAWKNAT